MLRLSRVMVVDDDAETLALLREVIAKEGHDVETAEDAETALVRLGEWQPELVITDIHMPGMDGLALLAAVREKEPDIPVVLLTAFGSLKTAVDAIKAGAFDYLSKPFIVDDIRLVVRRALEVSEAEIRVAKTRFEEHSIRHRGRPRCLRNAQRASEDADRFRGYAHRIDTSGGGAGAGPAQRLFVPEPTDLVAQGHLPGDARASVLEQPVRVHDPAHVRHIQPLRRVASVDVVVHVGACCRAPASMGGGEIPQEIPGDGSSDRPGDVVDFAERARRRDAHLTQGGRQVVKLESFSCCTGKKAPKGQVTPGPRHDRHEEPRCLRLAQAACDSEGHLLGDTGVHHKAGG